jgi:hypothetical protein
MMGVNINWGVLEPRGNIVGGIYEEAHELNRE